MTTTVDEPTLRTLLAEEPVIRALLIRETQAMEAIETVLAASVIDARAGSCADLHVDFGDGLHWESGCDQRCGSCAGPITMMVQKGTGFCSALCMEAPF